MSCLNNIQDLVNHLQFEKMHLNVYMFLFCNRFTRKSLFMFKLFDTIDD